MASSATPKLEFDKPLAGLLIFFVLSTAGCFSTKEQSNIASTSRTIPKLDIDGMQPAVVSVINDARQSVEQTPYSGEAWGRLAEVLDAHALHEQAQQAYSVAIELSPDNIKYAYNLALVFWYCDDLDNRSLKLLTSVADAEPSYAPVHFRLGQLFGQIGNLDASRKAYERALAIDPKLVIAHRALGQLWLRMDDTAAALRHLELAAARAPDDGPVQAALAELYERTGDHKSAEEAAEKARQFADSLVLQDTWRAEISACAMTADRCYERGKSLCQSQQYADALVQLQIAETQLDQIPELQYYLAVAYFGLGNRAKALGYLDTMLQLMKDDPATAHDAIGALYLTFNSLDDAISHFEQAIQLAPENSALHYRLAIALARSGRLAESGIAFDRGAKIKPPDAEAHFATATALLQQRTVDLQRRAMPDAIQHFREALTLDPSQPNLHAAYGRALELNGRNADAVEHYRQAVRIDPNHAVRKRLVELAGDDNLDRQQSSKTP